MTLKDITYRGLDETFQMAPRSIILTSSLRRKSAIKKWVHLGGELRYYKGLKHIARNSRYSWGSRIVS